MTYNTFFSLINTTLFTENIKGINLSKTNKSEKLLSKKYGRKASEKKKKKKALEKKNCIQP